MGLVLTKTKTKEKIKYSRNSDLTPRTFDRMIGHRVKLIYSLGGPKMDLVTTPYMQLLFLHPGSDYKWNFAISGTCSFEYCHNKKFYSNGIGTINHIGTLKKIDIGYGEYLHHRIEITIDDIIYIFHSDEQFYKHHDDIEIPHVESIVKP